jgi:hypothetical protein
VKIGQQLNSEGLLAIGCSRYKRHSRYTRPLRPITVNKIGDR